MEPTYTTSIENSTDLSFPPRIIALHFGIDEDGRALAPTIQENTEPLTAAETREAA